MAHGSNFGSELERRLALFESPDYQDPARADLTWVDVVALVAVIAVVLTVTALICLV